MDNEQMQTDKFLNIIKDLGLRLDNLERTTQPQLIDWYELNPSYFTYNANNVLDVATGLPVGTFFQVGDKFKITQTTVKYFYIIEVDETNNRLKLDAGDDHTFTSATFTTIGSSRLENPSGHPLIFDYSSSLTIITGTATATNDDTSDFTIDAKYSMSGAVVQLWYELGTTALRSGVLSLELSTPFVKRDQSSDGVYLSAFLTDGLVDLGGGLYDVDTLYKFFDTSGLSGTHVSDLTILIEPRSVGASFTSGTWGWAGSIPAGI